MKRWMPVQMLSHVGDGEQLVKRPRDVCLCMACPPRLLDLPPGRLVAPPRPQVQRDRLAPGQAEEGGGLARTRVPAAGLGVLDGKPEALRHVDHLRVALHGPAHRARRALVVEVVAADAVEAVAALRLLDRDAAAGAEPRGLVELPQQGVVRRRVRAGVRELPRPGGVVARADLHEAVEHAAGERARVPEAPKVLLVQLVLAAHGRAVDAEHALLLHARSHVRSHAHAADRVAAFAGAQDVAVPSLQLGQLQPVAFLEAHLAHRHDHLNQLNL
eukprot:CAMPEP_0179360732 /NCGR_PEP_ID=MMETSP0797-20121207/80131_1 /TAXON_ID=47934 /ORGANISM="Dinophysis acuminata, Strain DAEP01" /LENGTH=272 /DNA_ID=CAMNT_0021076101 /DNA_START=262 /DNA_END=1080 /DNA_ORIENTATION=-